VLEPN